MFTKTGIFRVEAAGQVYNQTNESVNLRGNVNHNANLFINVDRRITHAAASGSTPTTCTTGRAFPSSSKSGCQEPRYSRQCCPAASRGARTRALRHAPPSPPQLHDSLYRSAKEQLHRPSDFLSEHPHEDGKWAHQCDYAQEADPARGILWRALRIRDCRSA